MQTSKAECPEKMWISMWPPRKSLAESKGRWEGMHIVPGVIVDYSPGPGTPTPVANSTKRLVECLLGEQWVGHRWPLPGQAFS